MRIAGEPELPDDDESEAGMVMVDPEAMRTLQAVVQHVRARIVDAQGQGAEPNWERYYNAVTDAASAVLEPHSPPPRP